MNVETTLNSLEREIAEARAAAEDENEGRLNGAVVRISHYAHLLVEQVATW